MAKEEPTHREVISRDQETIGRDLNIHVYQSIMQRILVKRGVLSLSTIDKAKITGTLALYLGNWLKVSQDQWVLDTVRGYKMEFLKPPIQVTHPRVGVSAPLEQDLLKEEVQKLLSKGAVRKLTPEGAEQGFYSSLLLVPKKDGGMRPVINLKGLNEFVVIYIH